MLSLESVTEPESGTLPIAQRPRILLVDDEPSVLRGLRRAVAALRPNWQIDVADGGTVALCRLSERRYDLLVTDLEMPGIDGIALLTRAEAQFPDVLRMVHSSRVEDMADTGTSHLAQSAVHKPARPLDLIAAIEVALSTRSHRPGNDLLRAQA